MTSYARNLGCLRRPKRLCGSYSIYIWQRALVYLLTHPKTPHHVLKFPYQSDHCWRRDCRSSARVIPQGERLRSCRIRANGWIDRCWAEFVVCFGVYCVCHSQAILTRIARSLQPNGLLVLSKLPGLVEGIEGKDFEEFASRGADDERPRASRPRKR